MIRLFLVYIQILFYQWLWAKSRRKLVALTLRARESMRHA